MDQPARKHEFSFDPRIDDPAWRKAQQQRLLEMVREEEAQNGPVDPKILAEIEALAETWPP